METLDRDFDIWVLLHQARDAVVQARENELKDTGVNMVQAGLLNIIKNVEQKQAFQLHREDQ